MFEWCAMVGDWAFLLGALAMLFLELVVGFMMLSLWTYYDIQEQRKKSNWESMK